MVPPIAGSVAFVVGESVVLEVIRARTPWPGDSIGDYWSAAFWGMGIGTIVGAATLAGMLLRQRRIDVQTSVR